MSKFNKTISTTIVEQVKSAVIISLVVGIASFLYGMQYQKSNTPTVNNSVIVQAEKTAEATPALK